MLKHNLTACLNIQRPDKKGLFPLRIRSTIAREVRYYSTGIMLAKNQLNGGVIVNHANRLLLNTSLRNKVNEIEKELLENSITGTSTLKAKQHSNLRFSDYAAKKINEWAPTQDEATIRHKNSYLNKINEFKPKIKLLEFNTDVLTDIENCCRAIGNNENTVWSTTKFVKTVINAALADGTINRNPFIGFKGAKYIDPFRETLSGEEIEKMEAFAVNPLNSSKLLNVANWFLFSCYCGLRYGDLANFVGFKNGKVLLKTEKTGAIVSIFATEKIVQAKERIDKGIFSNQKSNDYLKIIVASIGIDKKITFHNARHTFAVEFLNRGGRMEILSKILGHSSLKTTSIYGRISNNLADEEMRKVWDKKTPAIADQGKQKTNQL